MSKEIFGMDVSDVEVKENKTFEHQFIKEGGKYLLKIESLVGDGYNDDSSPIAKLTFIGFKLVDGKADKSVSYTKSQTYPKTSPSGYDLRFLSKNLQEGLQIPVKFDFNDVVGRYLIADMYMKDGYANFGTLIYSKLNDKLEPVKELVINAKAPADTSSTVPEIEIDEDEIPF